MPKPNKFMVDIPLLTTCYVDRIIHEAIQLPAAVQGGWKEGRVVSTDGRANLILSLVVEPTKEMTSSGVLDAFKGILTKLGATYYAIWVVEGWTTCAAEYGNVVLGAPKLEAGTGKPPDVDSIEDDWAAVRGASSSGG